MEYDLDKYQCLANSCRQIESEMREILARDRRITVKSATRTVDIRKWGISIKPCCMYHAVSHIEADSFVIPNKWWKLTSTDRFQRRKTDNGFEIKLLKPVHSIKLGSYAIDITIIINADVELLSDIEITNPNAMPQLKCKLSLLCLKGGRKQRKKITAQLKDSLFYWKGKRLDAYNNEDVARIIADKIREISQ